ncbi:MAG: Gfo/Idh/MocA family oxidoreductase [Nocardioidaceae bacterium]
MTVRVGVLGLGSVYGAYAAGLERLVKDGRVEATAVFDIDQSKIGTGTKDFPSAVSVPSPDALIARPDVDAVLVLTSMNHHAPLAMEALSAGKHVLVEKPMATSLEQGSGPPGTQPTPRPSRGVRTTRLLVAHLPGDA